jgi:uroporphyrin-III C-methyltransferase/precorrin-2 dehydrogenase/sirohydrochlorin ferrochelatase
MADEHNALGPSGAELFPIFLKLEGRSVLLVGGGTIARGKLAELLRAGARVTVVAPEVHAEIAANAATVLTRRFLPADVDGKWFVVAAAPSEVNREVASAAAERRVFVNAVDDAERASAYTAGVFRRGGVTIAVSTEGRAPALAGLLREGLEAVVPKDIELWVATARELRQAQRAAGVPMTERRPRLLAALNRLYEAKGNEAAAATWADSSLWSAPGREIPSCSRSGRRAVSPRPTWFSTMPSSLRRCSSSRRAPTASRSASAPGARPSRRRRFID